MPNLALAAHSPAAALAAKAATGTAAPAPSAVGEAAGDLAQGTPFASVLQEQLAAQILMPASEFVGLPAAETAADAPATAAAVDLVPMLLGMAMPEGGLHPDTATREEDAPALPFAEAGSLATNDPAAAVPLALPAVAAPPALAVANGSDGQSAQGPLAAGSDAASGRPAATGAAGMPAILAAAGDAAKRGEGMIGSPKAEDALASAATERASEASSHRADAAVQAQAMRAAEQPQRIDAPVGSRQWDGEFANRLAWMVGKQEQRAELVLTPPQLGRIEISLSVSGDQATAIFTSPSSTVRDAIENALPRLREVLLEAGISLGQTQVGSESAQQSPARDENRDNRGTGVAAGHDSRGLPPGFAVNSPTAWVSSGRGMIDIFA